MRTHSLKLNLILAAACTLAGVLFFLDLVVPEAPFWSRYLLPVVVVFLWGRRRDIYIVTALAALLIVANCWLEQPLSLGELLANYALPVLILWGVAWLLAQRQLLLHLLARRERDLDDLVKTRTAALASREEQLAKIFRASPGGISITRQSDGCILDVNETYLAMLGYSRSDLIGHTLVELGILGAENRAGVAAAIRAAGSLHGLDLQLISACGDPVDVLCSFEEIEFDGEPCYLGLIMDIAERKQLEAQLRESEERFRLIVQNSPDIIALYDDQGCLAYVSPAIEPVYGTTAELALAVDPLLVEAIGILPGAGPHTAEPSGVRALSQFANRRRTAEAVNYCLQHPGVQHRLEVGSTLLSGEVRYYDVACKAHRRDGGRGQVVSISRDITERKRLEDALAAGEARLQAANAELERRVAARTADLEAALAELQRAGGLKDEFMAMISHELRTPLMGVLSLSEILADQAAGALNERQATYVKGIVSSGERLLNVINNIIGYTQLLAGKVQLRAEPCSLAYLLDIAAAAEHHKAAAKNQTIAVRAAPPDLAVMADAGAICEALKRLLDNAVKFTPEGGQLGLYACRGAAAGTVNITVWDTGAGIAESQLEHVFHAFTQADARLARSHNGIGIGLAYVDQIVRLHSGTIAVESTVGEGSRFTITLRAAG